ncbi:hypothetical protein [Bradyrhizobium sp. AZCC 1719]|uniref:hypothetical protein n=1 Tax=Bradyrhizobium sp. AZCC 1719 TaxID=3117028 RepID=UPI002FF31CC6
MAAEEAVILDRLLTEDAPMKRLARDFGMALTKLAAQDPEVHRLTVAVSQLLKPQAALREPALAARVMSLI